MQNLFFAIAFVLLIAWIVGLTGVVSGSGDPFVPGWRDCVVRAQLRERSIECDL